MNVTLKRLTIVSIHNSPLFSTSKSRGLNLGIRKSIFSNFSTHNLYTSSLRFSFTRSTFINFLKTPIHSEQNKYFERVFQKFHSFNNQINPQLKICIFINCSNTAQQGYGGALYYANPDGKISLIQCGFESCFSAFRSGAYYISAKTFLVKLCCVHQCSAGKNIVGFKITAKPELDILEEDASSAFEQCTCCYNGPIKYNKEDSLYVFSDTTAVIRNSNFTHAYGLHGDGTIAAENMGYFSISYSHIAQNNGPGMISFFANKQKTRIDNCNFIENDACQTSTFLSFSQGNTLLKNIIFKKNIFGVFISTDESNVNLVKCRGDFDFNNTEKLINMENCKFPEHSVKKMRAIPVEGASLYHCFELIISQYATQTVNNNAIKTIIPSLTQTKTAPFTAYPSVYTIGLIIQQYILFILIIITLPIMHLLLKNRGIKRRESKVFNALKYHDCL